MTFKSSISILGICSSFLIMILFLVSLVFIYDNTTSFDVENNTLPTPVASTIQNEFKYLQQKWRNQLVSDKYFEKSQDLINYIVKLSTSAIILYESMNKETNRNYLWPPVHGNSNPAELTIQFTKLHTLALAYGTKGTIYYRDSNLLSVLKSGLEFMVTKKNYNGKIYYGNWWDWQVGAPDKLTEIMMIIYEELSQEQRQQYIKIIDRYVPSSRQLLYYRLGDEKTNYIIHVPTICRAGLAKTVLALGILQEDYQKIKEASDCVTNVIKRVMNKITNRDDFSSYEKGPFRAFDYDVVYNIGQILSIIQDLRFQVDPEIADSFAVHITEVFVPLIYRGELVPPVLGRAVTRPNWAPLTSYNLLLLSKYASRKTKAKIENAVKHWVLDKPNSVNDPRDYKDLTLITALINDDSVTGDEMPFTGTKMYPTMDRFVQQTTIYKFVLSLHSGTGASFDSLHKENKRGWHTCDGMIYLNIKDDIQFSKIYWPTVDPYRLPGTTVDTIPLENENGRDTPKPTQEQWVGGVAHKNQAVIGMSLNKGIKRESDVFSMNLKAKKSWFVIHGQIVALGAGITGDSSASIETVVDNRLLNERYYYQVSTNHGAVADNENQTNVDWLILKSDQPSSIGYYFPNKEAIDIISETRHGCYRDINEAYPSDIMYNGNYKKFIINHGQNPFNSEYAYVILPGYNTSELIRYHNKKPVTILKNSATIQAVEIKEHNYLGVNIWSKTGGSIVGITSDKPISLIKQSDENETQDTYVLSDPTRTNSIVTIEIPYFSELVELSEGVTFDEQQQAFKVNFRNAAGESKVIIVKRPITFEYHPGGY